MAFLVPTQISSASTQAPEIPNGEYYVSAKYIQDDGQGFLRFYLPSAIEDQDLKDYYSEKYVTVPIGCYSDDSVGSKSKYEVDGPDYGALLLSQAKNFGNDEIHEKYGYEVEDFQLAKDRMYVSMNIILGDLESSSDGCESRLERLEVKELAYGNIDTPEIFSPSYYRDSTYPEGEYDIESVVYEDQKGKAYLKLRKKTIDEESEDMYFLIPIGCHEDGRIGNDTLDISGVDYDNLIRTTQEEEYNYNIRAKARLTMSEDEDRGDECYSPVVKAEFPYNESYRRGDKTGDILAGKFSDVDGDHKNADEIANMAALGLIDGYPDRTFRPDAPVNRAEIAKMIVNANQIILGSEEMDMDNTDCFSDVSDEWFAPYICYAKDKGWVNGYEDGTFKPEQSVTRVEAIKMTLASMYTGPDGMIAKIEKPTIQKFYNEFFKEWYNGDYEQIFQNKSKLPIFYKSDEYGCEKGCRSYIKMPQDYDENDWYAEYLEYSIRNVLVETGHVEDLSYPDREVYRLPENYNYFPSENMSRKEVAVLVMKVTREYVRSGEKILDSMQRYLYPGLNMGYTAVVGLTGCYVEGFGEDEIMDFFQERDDYYQSGRYNRTASQVFFDFQDDEHVEEVEEYFGEWPLSVDRLLEMHDEQDGIWIGRMSPDSTEEELLLAEVRYKNNPIINKIREAQEDGTLVCE
jgi:S-layer family protein